MCGLVFGRSQSTQALCHTILESRPGVTAAHGAECLVTCFRFFLQLCSNFIQPTNLLFLIRISQGDPMNRFDLHHAGFFGFFDRNVIF